MYSLLLYLYFSMIIASSSKKIAFYSWIIATINLYIRMVLTIPKITFKYIYY
jgi:hypothetical protein